MIRDSIVDIFNATNSVADSSSASVIAWMLESLIISLVLTLAIETALALLAGLRGEANIEAVLLINLITNPVLVFITNTVHILSRSFTVRDVVLVILEMTVVFVEGAFFKKTLKNFKMNPYLFALYLNALSFGIGIVIDLMLK